MAGRTVRGTEDGSVFGFSVRTTSIWKWAESMLLWYRLEMVLGVCQKIREETSRRMTSWSPFGRQDGSRAGGAVAHVPQAPLWLRAKHQQRAGPHGPPDLREISVNLLRSFRRNSLCAKSCRIGSESRMRQFCMSGSTSGEWKRGD